MGSSTEFRMEECFRYRLMRGCGGRFGRPDTTYARRFQPGCYRSRRNRGSGAKNASTQTIVETCGSAKVRRSDGVLRRNHIREESRSQSLCKCCRMCLFGSGCKTIPYEKGTETHTVDAEWSADYLDARPSPTRRG